MGEARWNSAHLHLISPIPIESKANPTYLCVRQPDVDGSWVWALIVGGGDIALTTVVSSPSLPIVVGGCSRRNTTRRKIVARRREVHLFNLLIIIHFY